MTIGENGKRRCFGKNDLYAHYHDFEWGIPSHEDRYLFEMLILEGAQAGLSWEIILKKREGYRRAFYNFDPKKVALMSDLDLERLTHNADIIRNKLKIHSARTNALCFLKIQKEFSSFDSYLWEFVDFKPILNHWKTFKEVPSSSELSDRISKDLKKRGMKFVGTTIIYSYMQAIGMVNDHTIDCWRYSEASKIN